MNSAAGSSTFPFFRSPITTSPLIRALGFTSWVQQASRRKTALGHPVATRRSRVSPQDRCAKACVSPGGIPTSTLGAVSTEHCRPQQRQDLACHPGTDAQRIAHRHRWHAVWPPRRRLHGNSEPLLQSVSSCSPAAPRRRTSGSFTLPGSAGGRLGVLELLGRRYARQAVPDCYQPFRRPGISKFGELLLAC